MLEAFYAKPVVMDVPKVDENARILHLSDKRVEDPIRVNLGQ